MKDFKVHIAFLMFLGFTFPQIANSVHYLIYEHLPHVDAASVAQLTTPAYDYHFCDYHLSGLSLLQDQTAEENNGTGDLYSPAQIFYSGDHNIEIALYFHRRGPPVVQEVTLSRLLLNTINLKLIKDENTI